MVEVKIYDFDEAMKILEQLMQENVDVLKRLKAEGEEE